MSGQVRLAGLLVLPSAAWAAVIDETAAAPAIVKSVRRLQSPVINVPPVSFPFLLIEGQQPAKSIFHPTPPQPMCLNSKAQKKCFDTLVEHLFCGIAIIETISEQ
jgi:hypothetical protein